MRRVRAYVGLGANIGDASETLATGVRTLAVLPGVRLHAVSRLYVTRPVGVEDQPPFRNAVVALDVPAGPDRQTGAIALLVALKGLERAFGRRAGRARSRFRAVPAGPTGAMASSTRTAAGSSSCRSTFPRSCGSSLRPASRP